MDDKVRRLLKILALIFLGLSVSSHAKEQTTEEKYLTKSEVKDLSLFDHFQYRVSGHGEFVLSSDKKSFYSNERLVQHKIKQIDIHTSKVISMSNDGDDVYISAIAPWGKYLIAWSRLGRGDDAILNLVLLETINGELKQVRAKSISDDYIPKIFIKDQDHILAINRKGAVFELDKQLNIKARYQLQDVDESYSGGVEASCYDNKRGIIYYPSKSHEIKVFDLTKNSVTFTSEPMLVAESKYDNISSLQLNEKRTKIIGAFDNELAVYDLKTQQKRVIGRNHGSIHTLTISPDFKTIITTGMSGGLTVWDYKTGVIKKELQVQSHGLKESLNSTIDSVAFIDNDRFLYASSLQDVRMARLSDNKMIREYSNKIISPWLKKISDTQLGFINPNGSIYYFDLEKEQFTDVDDIPLDNVKRVISNGNARMLLSERDGHFILLNVKDKRYKDEGLSFRDHFTAQYALHPRLNMFAQASTNDTLQLFDIKTRHEVKKVRDELFNDPNVLAFLDENIILYSGSKAGFTEDGDLASVKQIKPYMQFVDTKKEKFYNKKGHIDEVNDYDITFDKKFLLTASSDRTIKLWRLDLKHPRRIKELDTAYGEMGEVSSVYFNQAQDKVLSFGHNGSIVIRDIDLKKGQFGKAHVLRGELDSKGKQRRRTWDEHMDGFFISDKSYYGGIFFDGDKKFIAIDSNGNINVIDANTGSALYRIILFGLRDWLKIYPDGTYLSSKNGYKYITRYDEKGNVIAEDIDISDSKVLQDNETYEQERREALKEIRKSRYDEILDSDFSTLSLDELHQLKEELYAYYAYTRDAVRIMPLFLALKKRGVTEDETYIRRFKLFLHLDSQVDQLNKRLTKKYNIEVSYYFSFWDDEDNKKQDNVSYLKLALSKNNSEIILIPDQIKNIEIANDQVRIRLKDNKAVYTLDIDKQEQAMLVDWLKRKLLILYAIEREFNAVKMTE